jgi:hypothetical protein
MFVPAWILILVALFVVWLLVKQRRAPRFAPYRVTIRPEWPALLDDHLDMTPERWEAIRQWGSGQPDEAMRPWTHGITFTVLTPREHGRLTYINNGHAFQATLDWHGPITGLHWPPSERDRLFRPDGPQPRLLVLERADAYELMIEVDDAAMLNPARRADARTHQYSVDGAGMRITVARLPLAAFDAPREARTIDALAKGGWGAPAFHPDVFGAPIEIEHRYAHVSFSHI